MPLDKSFQPIYNDFIKRYGKDGKPHYYAWLKGRRLDDTKTVNSQKDRFKPNNEAFDDDNWADELFTELLTDFHQPTGSYSFDTSGREEYVDKMKAIGYVERPEFENYDQKHSYSCESCEYFKTDQNTVTGNECEKFNFPDKAYGCCDHWDINPNLNIADPEEENEDKENEKKEEESESESNQNGDNDTESIEKDENILESIKHSLEFHSRWKNTFVLEE